MRPLGVTVFIGFIAFFGSMTGAAAESQELQANNLVKMGTDLAERSRYLEAVEIFEEARNVLESAGLTSSMLYADAQFFLAQTMIKARLHQGFPAFYVKAALESVQSANKLREGLPKMLPQKLAEGYFLEGYIHKKFFMRRKEAAALLEKAVNIDPGSTAAKRELSELISEDDQQKQ